MLIDSGEISEEEARTHPEAGMLTRALGHGRMADGRPLVPDVLAEPITMQETDALVLCSDGLHDLIEDWEIGRIVAGRNGDEAAHALVELACERGGHDNVTVAVVVGGARASEYDPNYQPPVADTAESTYTGYDGGDTADQLPPMPQGGQVVPPPASTGVFHASSVREASADFLPGPGADGGFDVEPPAKQGGGGMKWIMFAVAALLLLGAGVVLLVVVAGVGWMTLG
jgi:hypothetical protein